MKIEEIVSRPVVTVRANTGIKEAARLPVALQMIVAGEPTGGRSTSLSEQPVE